MRYVGAKENEDKTPPQLSPPGEIRRGAAIMTAICAVLLAIGRALFWRGKDTATFAAFALFFLLLYTLFALAQTLFGFSISEMYQNFWRLSGKLKAVYFAMLLLTVVMLTASCAFLFPGIDDKIHR